MNTIVIVGAGEAGLLLGIGLVKKGFKVTLVSNKTPDEVRCSQVTSSQAVFRSSLSIERNMGIYFWDELCPKNGTVSCSMTSAVNTPQIANLLANAFDNLPSIFPWILSLEDTHKLIYDYTGKDT